MENDIIIDWARFYLAEKALGQRLESVVDWFDDDGASAILSIARAVDGRDGLTIIRVAGLLTLDALQIGALSVSEKATACELAARDCLDDGAPWQQVHVSAGALANAHRATLDILWRELEAQRTCNVAEARAA